MNRNAKRCLVVLLTVCFSTTVLTLNAFAEIGSSSDASPSSLPDTPSDVSSRDEESFPEEEPGNSSGGNESAPAVSERNSAGVPSSRKPSSYASVDTHENEIEAAASRAAEAISDPDALSSEDWNSLLSESSGTPAGAGALSSGPSSRPAGGSGGGTWLFPVGIALIILSACGIGTFVYLQFFSGSGPGRHGPRPSGSGLNGAGFTDVSSSSDGPYPGPDEVPGAPAAPVSDSDETEIFPRPAPDRIRSSEKKGPPPGLPTAQAKPVDGTKGDFDWDKFFNDDF